MAFGLHRAFYNFKQTEDLGWVHLRIFDLGLDLVYPFTTVASQRYTQPNRDPSSGTTNEHGEKWIFCMQISAYKINGEACLLELL